MLYLLNCEFLRTMGTELVHSFTRGSEISRNNNNNNNNNNGI